jgi:hypothetical protein
MIVLKKLFNSLEAGLKLLHHGANLHPIAGGQNQPLIDSVIGFESNQGFPELSV